MARIAPSQKFAQSVEKTIQKASSEIAGPVDATSLFLKRGKSVLRDATKLGG